MNIITEAAPLTDQNRRTDFWWDAYRAALTGLMSRTQYNRDSGLADQVAAEQADVAYRRWQSLRPKAPTPAPSMPPGHRTLFKDDK